MTKFNIGLFLLTLPAFLVQGNNSKLRGTALERKLDESQGYNQSIGEILDEQFGSCTGAVCEMWGDPHVVTCDGATYDCQGVGTFNLMQNHLYNIQGRFVEVGNEEREITNGWGMRHGASITNDLAIEIKTPNTPVFQLGFGDLSTHDGTYISEKGCTPNAYYTPTNMAGQHRSVEDTLADCRERCMRTEGCAKFSYWSNKGCHLLDKNAVAHKSPTGWTRSVIGEVEKCGLPPELRPLDDAEEEEKHGGIWKSCPLLFHVDGELVNINHIFHNGYLYYGQDGNVTVQMIDNRYIEIKTKMENGDTTEVVLKATGKGPGELWSCHWNFHICLPASHKDIFVTENSIGLLGTPDGDKTNDWMDSAGNTLELKNWGQGRAENEINYCYENHCVSQGDSIMIPPKGQTYEDIKCEEEEFYDPETDPHCVLTIDQVNEACADMPPLFVHACKVDCCNGGCDDIDDTVGGLKELGDEDDDSITDDLIDDDTKPPSPCEGDELYDTNDTVCPSSTTEVVKLQHTSGEPLPEDAEVFYGIQMDAGNGNIGRTVKFKVNNPFDEVGDIYVQYEESSFGHAFMDPKCDGITSVSGGCNAEAPEFEVACHDYDGIDAFALVTVWFVNPQLESFTEIKSCCKAPEYADIGVVEYTFEIQCACPDNNIQ